MSQTLLYGLRAGTAAAQYAPRLVGYVVSNRWENAVAAAPAPAPVPAPVPAAPGAGVPAPAPGGAAPAPAPAPGTTTPAPATTAPAVEFPDIFLTLLVWGTALFALIILFQPERTAVQRGRIRTSAMLGTGMTLLLALFAFNTEISNDIQGGLPTAHDERRGWLGGLGIHADYHLTADGVTLALLVVTTVLFVVAVIASFKVDKHIRLYYALLLLLETGVTGVLLANDLLVFLLFWGMTIVPMYLLIHRWGGAGRVAAARRYLNHALLGYGLLIVGVVILVAVADQGTFDLQQLAGTNLPYGFSVAAFFLLFGGFGISMGVFPFHGWLAESHAEAGAPVAAIAYGALVTLGGYGMIRVLLQVAGPMTSRYSLLVVVLALLTVAYGAFSTLRQRDLRRGVSHFAIAQSGVVLLAIGCHSTTAVIGAVVLLVANALAVAALHLAAGAVEGRTRTGRIDQLGGLGTRLPRLTGFWVMAVLSAIGMPFLAGFSGLFLVVVGSFPVHRVVTTVVAGLLLVSAAALIRLTQRAFQGEVPEAFERLQDVDANELWQLAPLITGVLLWGVLPGRALPMVTNAVTQTIARHIGGA